MRKKSRVRGVATFAMSILALPACFSPDVEGPSDAVGNTEGSESTHTEEDGRASTTEEVGDGTVAASGLDETPSDTPDSLTSPGTSGAEDGSTTLAQTSTESGLDEGETATSAETTEGASEG